MHTTFLVGRGRHAWRATMAVVGLVLVSTTRAADAQGASCPPRPPASDTTAYLPCQVEPARPLPDRGVPAYPGMLQSQGFGGGVRVQVVIDTTGRAIVGSLRVHESSHQLLAAAVRSSAPHWRFEPARLDGRAVRMLLVREYVFATGEAGAGIHLAGLGPPVARHEWLADGSDRVTLTFGGTSDAPPDSATAALAARRALDTLVAEISQRSRATPARAAGMTQIFCVAPLTLGDSGSAAAEPDVALLGALTRPGVAALPVARCPRAFSSMIARVDSLGRRVPQPAGDDPVVLTVRQVRPFTPDADLVSVRERGNLYGQDQLCLVPRAAGPVICRGTRYWVH